MSGRSQDPTLLHLWAIAMRAEARSPETIRIRVAAVQRAARFAARPTHDLSRDDIRAWLARFDNPNTISTYFAAAAAFHAFLQVEGHREDNPMALMRRPKVPRGLPRPCATGALHAMLEEARDEDRPKVVLAAFQGMRAAEVAGVRGEHVDRSAQTLRVRGKGRRERVLPLHPVVAELAAGMPAVGWWFPSPAASRAGLPVLPSAVTGAVRRACVAAGTPGHGAHPLRHWFGTWLVREGADLRTAQELLGHASLATTAIYVEVTDEARRAAVLRLPGLPEAGAR